MKICPYFNQDCPKCYPKSLKSNDIGRKDRCVHDVDGNDCFECYPTPKPINVPAKESEGWEEKWRLRFISDVMATSTRSERARLFREMMNEISTLLTERDNLWKEYHDFIVKENEAPLKIAFNRGWTCPEKVFDKGEEYRKRLGIYSENI